jgi:hypothetical protein
MSKLEEKQTPKYKVQLYLYDITQGMAKNLSKAFLGSVLSLLSFFSSV